MNGIISQKNKIGLNLKWFWGDFTEFLDRFIQ